VNLNKWWCALCLALLCCSYFSCEKKEKIDHSIIIKSEKIGEEIFIPKIIFDGIIKDIRKESATAEPVYLFIPLDVELWSESKEVIPQRFKVSLSNGGGALDLAKYLKGQGSFYLRFPGGQFEALPKLEHLYFVSKMPKQDIDDEEFGLGCGKWVDIQKKFKELQEDSFLKLNTTKERHIYTAGGYYIFVFRKANQIYLTHLNLFDSRFKKKECPEIPLNKNNQGV